MTLHNEKSWTTTKTWFVKQAYSIYSWIPSVISGMRYPAIPRLIGNPFVGRLPEFFKTDGIWRNFIASGELALSHPSGMSYYWVGNKAVILITKPNDVKELLVKQRKNNKRTSFAKFDELIGTNILSDQEDIWRKKKTVYKNHLYFQAILDSYFPILIRNVNKFLQQINDNPVNLNLNTLIREFIYSNLAECVVLNDEADEKVAAGLQGYLEDVTKKVFTYNNSSKWQLPTFFRRCCFRAHQKQDNLQSEIRRKLDEVLLNKRKNPDRDFLHDIYMLRQSMEDVYGDASILFFAGVDTSVSVISFAIKLLDKHPEYKQRLRDELNQASTPNLTLENLKNFKLLDAIIKETLRLYPPVSFLAREATGPLQLGGVSISKGDMVIYSPYFTHRRPELWEKPNEFRPERFLNHSITPEATYIPFGHGEQECVGQHFSLRTTKYLLANLYKRYDLNLTQHDFRIHLKSNAVISCSESCEVSFEKLETNQKLKCV